MAGFGAIANVGASMERLVNRAFADRPPIPNAPNPPASARLVRTEDFPRRQNGALTGVNLLSIFLYRVDFDRTMRTPWAVASGAEENRRLALILHYLITPWAENAVHEHLILGRAMQALEEVPTLSGPLLHAASPPVPNNPGPSVTEAVNLVLEEISTEALMRIFDSLPTDYRISVTYVARVVTIETRAGAWPPVSDATVDIGVPA